MGIRFFSDKNRPVHMGPYPLERLARQSVAPDLSAVPPMPVLSFQRPDQPESIVNAMGEFQAMMDAIRDGFVNAVPSEIPADPSARAHHLKAFGYFNDASMMGCGPLPAEAMLPQPRHNPDIDRLAHALKTRQTKTLASGIDVIMADLKESMEAAPKPMDTHRHAIVFVYEHNRDPDSDEPGSDWIMDAQDHRSCLLATENAVVIANYIRLLGFDARAHTAMSSEVDLGKLAVAAGLASVEDGDVVVPWLGKRFGLAAVTTEMEIAYDQPLQPMAQQPWFRTQGPAWWLGTGFAKNALNRDAYAKRRYVDGAHPFEKLKRVEDPTTYIDEENVARVPKLADMFARAQFGDMGKPLQDAARGGTMCARPPPVSPSAAHWAHLCYCRMATAQMARARPMPPEMPRISRPRPISLEAMPWASAVARNGRGTLTTRPEKRSTRPMIKPSA